ncbi:hypothetical protein PV797_09485 [Clostridiaceae bacterium M8S5]|nr:hypothetical protein PV797_09485 [Clostridiaceae bacterium M8S5]
MPRKKKDIKVVIVNPEAIPKAKETITRVAYHAYLESTKKTEIEKEMK